MNYTEITELALSYADREDEEVTSRVDQFLRLVESRINRKLKVLEMVARSVVDLTTTDPDQKYFQLPDDWMGLRDIEINIDGGSNRTCYYVNPEQMNTLQNGGNYSESVAKVYYTIIARQIQIYPPQQDGFLEIVYYQQVPPLTADDNMNWISTEYPDIYIHGLLVEINSFVKDRDALTIWKARFDESLGELHVEDRENRWSGTPLETRLG